MGCNCGKKNFVPMGNKKHNSNQLTVRKQGNKLKKNKKDKSKSHSRK